MARRAFPFQPTMDSGFPHHRDSWISAAATSWSVLALTQAAPAGSVAGNPAVARRTSPAPGPADAPRVDFARQIGPILERSCLPCHGGEQPRGLYRVEGRDSLLRGGASGSAAIVPGRSDRSPLIDSVSGVVPDAEMPPRAHRGKFPGLSADEVAILRAWIDQGAGWPGGVVLTSPGIERQR